MGLHACHAMWNQSSAASRSPPPFTSSWDSWFVQDGANGHGGEGSRQPAARSQRERPAPTRGEAAGQRACPQGTTARGGVLLAAAGPQQPLQHAREGDSRMSYTRVLHMAWQSVELCAEGCSFIVTVSCDVHVLGMAAAMRMAVLTSRAAAAWQSSHHRDTHAEFPHAAAHGCAGPAAPTRPRHRGTTGTKT